MRNKSTRSVASRPPRPGSTDSHTDSQSGWPNHRGLLNTDAAGVVDEGVALARSAVHGTRLAHLEVSRQLADGVAVLADSATDLLRPPAAEGPLDPRRPLCEALRVAVGFRTLQREEPL
jgi:hypothetical protein